MVVRLSKLTTAVCSSNNVGISSRIAQIGNRTEHVILVSGSDRLIVSFVIYLGTPHNNAPT
jgi:glycine cleavage system regulatory protein